MQAGDRRIDLPPVEALKQVARRSDADFDQQTRVLFVHACDQRREFRAGHVIAYAYHEALAVCGECRQRTIVCLDKFACAFKEGYASRRELHVAWRTLDQP